MSFDRTTPNPRPRDGYAFESTRRHPKAPEIVSISVADGRVSGLQTAYSGTELLDGSECNAWRVTGPGIAPFYVFQSVALTGRARR